MEYILTESQFQKLILESKNQDITQSLKELYQEAKNLLDECAQTWGLNAKFLITWGASLGGMILPLKNYLENNNPELTHEQIILLVLGVVSNYFYDNETFIRKVVKKIKEEGLLNVFRKLYDKAEELKRALGLFLNSIKVTANTLYSILSYAFILPVLGDLYGLSQGEDTIETTKLIVQRILASGVVLVVGAALNHFVSKVVNRLKD
jgi:hypothetical protein